MTRRNDFRAELAQAKMQYIIAVSNVSLEDGNFARRALEDGFSLGDVKTCVARRLSPEQLLDLNAEFSA